VFLFLLQRLKIKGPTFIYPNSSGLHSKWHTDQH